MTNRTLHITINPNPTDADLIKQIIKGAKYCNAGWDVRLVVAGYENDPRELHEIASLLPFCSRGAALVVCRLCPLCAPVDRPLIVPMLKR